MAQHGRRDGVLDGLRRVVEPLAEGRNVVQQVAHLVLHAVVALSLADAVEIAGERADRGRDGHLVVVEENDQARLEVAGLIDRLHRHPTC
jgi:hypothetical protein